MRNFFNMDNPIFVFLSRLADLVVLNLIFLICCIPVITIGPALTGMHYTLLKVVNKEEPYIVKSFWKSFKLNFKQGLILGVIYLILGAILFFDYQIVITGFPETLGKVFVVLIMFFAFVYFMLVSYTFPVLARFYNKTTVTVKNSLFMAIRHLPYTLLIIALPIGCVVVTFLNGYTFIYGLLCWILIGFSLITMLQDMLFNRIFKHYIIPDEEELS